MTTSPFGRQLKHWRTLRGMSQQSLAFTVGSSARHVSFIETGRSRPGEDLVNRIANALGVPKRGRNELLRAAGLAPIYSDEPLESPELARYSMLVDRLLEKHRPFPAAAIDHNWTILKVNRAARMLFGEGCVGSNSVDVLWALREHIENFDEVVASTRQRLLEERFDNPDNDVLDSLLARMEKMAPRETLEKSGAIVTARYRTGDEVIETIMTVARFGTANHVQLDELRVELIYPTDEAGERFFAAIDGPGGR